MSYLLLQGSEIMMEEGAETLQCATAGNCIVWTRQGHWTQGQTIVATRPAQGPASPDPSLRSPIPM